MRAVVMTGAGEPGTLALRELPEPEIDAPHQIKVRLRAAGVNPVDAKQRARGLYTAGALPAVLGCDGAGVVVETGAGVTRFRPGDEVWFCDGGIGGAQGCYAEFKVLHEDHARAKPASLDFVHAAAAPLALITAAEALFDRARVRPGARVLIHGGTGGVGHVAIQLAVIAGARVMATVGSRDKADHARALGAEATVIYPERDFVEAVADWTGGAGVEVALDTVGGEVFRRTIPAVAHYGDLVTLLEPGADTGWKEARLRNLRITFVLMLTPMLRELPAARARQGEILDTCAGWCEEGRLVTDVDDVLPLAEAAEAHRRIEQGHTRGKLVLDIG